MLRQVIEHHVPLDSILDETSGNPHFLELDQRDRALVRAIVGVALRRRGEIEAALAKALDKPLPENTGALSALLHVAAAQILFLDVPDHAAVNLAVAQAGGSHRTGRARGLVNGVLREIVRNRTQDPSTVDAVRLNTPAWLFERWSAAYGGAVAEKIAVAHLAMPALDLSVKSEPRAPIRCGANQRSKNCRASFRVGMPPSASAARATRCSPAPFTPSARVLGGASAISGAPTRNVANAAA